MLPLNKAILAYYSLQYLVSTQF